MPRADVERRSPAPYESAGPPRAVRVAQILVTGQALGLVVVLVIAIVLGTVYRIWIVLSLAGLVVLTSLVLALCARGLGRGQISSRAPVLITELLCLPVGYSLGVQAGRLAFGGPLMAVAALVIAVLFSPSARAWLE